MQLQSLLTKSGLLAVLALSTLESGFAEASTFEAGVIDANCIGAFLGPSPASGSWTNSTFGTGISSASAFAFGGRLGGEASASSLGNTSSFNGAAACFKASMVIDDIIISGPGTDVSVQVSAHISGTLVFSTGIATGNGSARMNAETVGGAGLSATALFSTGSLTGQNSVDTTLTTVSFTAPVGQPFAVRMFLQSEVTAMDNVAPPDPVTANSQLGMHFIQGSPVFSLPAGYTANSGDGNIVDNQFVGPSVPTLGAPATVALVILLTTLGARKLVRRRRDLPAPAD